MEGRKTSQQTLVEHISAETFPSVKVVSPLVQSPEKWKDEDLGWFPNPVVFCKNSSRSFGPIVPRGNAFATVL